MAGAKAKTINLLLYEGDLEGVISIEDSSWNSGELYSAPRGMRATSIRSLPMRSTSAMPFCRRPIRSAFWRRSEAPTTVRCRSTMWKAVTKPLLTRMCS